MSIWRVDAQGRKIGRVSAILADGDLVALGDDEAALEPRTLVLSQTGPQGEPGEKGDKGDPGQDGRSVVGRAGAPGPQGVKGDRGDQGDRGVPGRAGTDGLRGPKGDTGDRGDPGPQGPAGGIGGSWNEVPTGDIDGANAVFQVAVAPSVMIMLFKNGLLQSQGADNDFVLSGRTITFVAGNVPQDGDSLVASSI